LHEGKIIKNMSEKTVALLGATGLTGSYLLELLLADPAFSTIKLLTRRPLEKTHTKLEIKLVDFSDKESVKLALEGTDIIFCCIGTTMQKVKGDKTLYRSIDFDIPVHAARLGKETGCENFIHMSSIGADSTSKNFYLQLKGETEDALRAVGFRSLYIMRPSVLIGERKEFRLAERISAVIMSPLSFLIPAKYRPIKSVNVAKAMLHSAKENKEGVFILENKAIHEAGS